MSIEEVDPAIVTIREVLSNYFAAAPTENELRASVRRVAVAKQLADRQALYLQGAKENHEELVDSAGARREAVLDRIIDLMPNTSYGMDAGEAVGAMLTINGRSDEVVIASRLFEPGPTAALVIFPPYCNTEKPRAFQLFLIGGEQGVSPALVVDRDAKNRPKVKISLSSKPGQVYEKNVRHEDWFRVSKAVTSLPILGRGDNVKFGNAEESLFNPDGITVITSVGKVLDYLNNHEAVNREEIMRLIRIHLDPGGSIEEDVNFITEKAIIDVSEAFKNSVILSDFDWLSTKIGSPNQSRDSLILGIVLPAIERFLDEGSDEEKVKFASILRLKKRDGSASAASSETVIGAYYGVMAKLLAVAGYGTKNENMPRIQKILSPDEVCTRLLAIAERIEVSAEVIDDLKHAQQQFKAVLYVAKFLGLSGDLAELMDGRNLEETHSLLIKKLGENAFLALMTADSADGLGID